MMSLIAMEETQLLAGESPLGITEAAPLSAQEWGYSVKTWKILISNFKNACPGAGGVPCFLWSAGKQGPAQVCSARQLQPPQSLRPPLRIGSAVK